MITEVVDVHKIHGHRPDYDVYIGRSVPFTEDSKWANPYNLSKFTLQESLDMYRVHIHLSIMNDPEEYNLDQLIGKKLGCWCRNRRDNCHGLILLDLLKKKYPKSHFINKWTLDVKKDD